MRPHSHIPSKLCDTNINTGFDCFCQGNYRTFFIFMLILLKNEQKSASRRQRLVFRGKISEIRTDDVFRCGLGVAIKRRVSCFTFSVLFGF